MNEDPRTSQAQETGISRRDFFRRLGLSDRPVQKDAQSKRSKTQCALGGLSNLPDETLAAVVPMFRRDLKVTFRDTALEARNQLGDLVAQVELSETQRLAVGLFDGERNLGQVAVAVEDGGLPEREAWEITKQVFLELAGRALCHPAGPLL